MRRTTLGNVSPTAGRYFSGCILAAITVCMVEEPTGLIEFETNHPSPTQTGIRSGCNCSCGGMYTLSPHHVPIFTTDFDFLRHRERLFIELSPAEAVTSTAQLDGRDSAEVRPCWPTPTAPTRIQDNSRTIKPLFSPWVET